MTCGVCGGTRWREAQQGPHRMLFCVGCWAAVPKPNATTPVKAAGSPPQAAQKAKPSQIPPQPENVARKGRIEVAAKEDRTADGIVFASKREMLRYQELKLLEAAGEIANLELQKRYGMRLNGVHICDYVADFVYIEIREGVGRAITEDCKGMRTEVYKLKRKMMKAFHGIDIRET